MSRFWEAFRLLGRHLGLFAAIVFSVWLPGNLLINYVAYNGEDLDELRLLRMTIWIDAIFGPIYIGALIYALNQIKSGQSVTYWDAISVGMRKWGSLFAARFVAGIFIGLGLIAFVIPGIMLAVRYALLDSAVIVEGKGASDSRARSLALTEGRRWRIFGSAVCFFVPFTVLLIVVYLPFEFIDSLNYMAVEVLVDCLVDLAYTPIQIVMFLFYWEATREESAEPLTVPHGLPSAAQAQPFSAADNQPFGDQT